MATTAINERIYINGIAYACHLTNADFPAQNDLKDKTALCTTGAKEYVIGQNTRSFKGSGFFSHSNTDASIDLNGQLAAFIGSSTPFALTLVQSGLSVGSFVEMMDCFLKSYGIQATVGELQALSIEAERAQGGDAYEIGTLLMAETVTNARNGSTYNAGSSKSCTKVRFINSAGDDDCNFQLQKSSNGSVWVDVGNSERLQIAEYLDVEVSDSAQYWRVQATPVGTTNDVCTVIVLV